MPSKCTLIPDVHAFCLACQQDVDNLPASEARRRLEAFRKKQQVSGGEGIRLV